MQQEQPIIMEFNNCEFDDIETIQDKTQIFNYLQSEFNGSYFEPPINLQTLANTFISSSYHSSPIYVKRNILSRAFIPHPLLSRAAFARLTLDLLVLGNCYLERKYNKAGELMPFIPALAKYVRVTNEKKYLLIKPDGSEFKFAGDNICHVLSADINQEIYGVPEYLAAINSAWLDKAATIFRRRYYLNGSHAGFILYLTNPTHNETDIDTLKKSLKDSRGVGNFRNLVIYAPSGKPDGLKLIPIGEVAAKDNFSDIKETSREDILAAHRVPPVLMGITPKNSAGFGDPEKALNVFIINEISPLMEQFKQINDWVGKKIVEFDLSGIASVE